MDVCEEYQKEQKLARLLEEIGCEPQNKILIFVETKRKADDLTRLMRRDGYVYTYFRFNRKSAICLLSRIFYVYLLNFSYPAMCIHGDKQQKERDWVLGEFR